MTFASDKENEDKPKMGNVNTSIQWELCSQSRKTPAPILSRGFGSSNLASNPSGIARIQDMTVVENLDFSPEAVDLD